MPPIARIRPVLVPVAALLALAARGPTARGAGRADGLTVVSSDASGVTLRFAAPDYRFVPVDRPEGRFFRIDAPGLTVST